jgi:hypothetical protein
MVEFEVLVPSLKYLYTLNKSDTWVGQQRRGFKQVQVRCSKMQRMQGVVMDVAKHTGLRYYKDLRLVVEREYSQRVVDDDELVYKVLTEVGRSRLGIVLRKVIYINEEIEQRETANDKERLSLQAGQIINELKMGRYRLDYESYLVLAALSCIASLVSQHVSIDSPSKIDLPHLAKQAQAVVLPEFSALAQGKTAWVEDFVRVFGIIYGKLKEVAKHNMDKAELQHPTDDHQHPKTPSTAEMRDEI